MIKNSPTNESNGAIQSIESNSKLRRVIQVSPKMARLGILVSYVAGPFRAVGSPAVLLPSDKRHRNRPHIREFGRKPNIWMGAHTIVPWFEIFVETEKFPSQK